ncbi:MAG: adenosine deaminase [Paracoccaceae bacterium]|nr:adenosine deaminase [Paracoccaceae bacterium]MDG1738348.1 adenosine deaminase [Paracoccaceae bacterium]MDG2258903.1 adenosine deaminase [Paracoccaceae bacterium]
MNLQQLPKVELHLHLEGAAPPAFIRRLGQEKDVNLSGVFSEDGNYIFNDFVDFLRVYEAATEVLKSPDDFRRLIEAVLAESASHGVIYTEMFISPDFCGGADLGAWREYLHAMQDGAERAEVEHGIKMRGIVTCIRHMGPDQAKKAAHCAAETAGDWIVGFGMGGDENVGHQSDYAYSFDMAKEAGLRLTTHAGEWRGPQEVRDAIALGAERIGHGVRCASDPELVKELVARGTVLEVCPGSNVTLGVYPSLSEHPLHRLAEAGVAVTVSTDDPPFFHSTMTSEYEGLAKTFGWDEERFLELARTSANAAFCDVDTRAELLKRIDAQ